MASTCINPQCREDHLVFGAGSLFAISTTHQNRQIKARFAWMCASCSRAFTATMNDDEKVVVSPRLGLIRGTAVSTNTRMKMLFCADGIPLPVPFIAATGHPGTGVI